MINNQHQHAGCSGTVLMQDEEKSSLAQVGTSGNGVERGLSKVPSRVRESRLLFWT